MDTITHGKSYAAGIRWNFHECLCCRLRRKGAKAPGLLVFQEAFGVNAHIRDVTDRFAKQGYVAIAPEMFHRTAPGFEGDYSNFPAVHAAHAGAHAGGHDRRRARGV